MKAKSNSRKIFAAMNTSSIASSTQNSGKVNQNNGYMDKKIAKKINETVANTTVTQIDSKINYEEKSYKNERNKNNRTFSLDMSANYNTYHNKSRTKANNDTFNAGMTVNNYNIYSGNGSTPNNEIEDFVPMSTTYGTNKRYRTDSMSMNENNVPSFTGENVLTTTAKLKSSNLDLKSKNNMNNSSYFIKNSLSKFLSHNQAKANLQIKNKSVKKNSLNKTNSLMNTSSNNLNSNHKVNYPISHNQSGIQSPAISNLPSSHISSKCAGIPPSPQKMLSHHSNTSNQEENNYISSESLSSNTKNKLNEIKLAIIEVVNQTKHKNAVLKELENIYKYVQKNLNSGFGTNTTFNYFTDMDKVSIEKRNDSNRSDVSHKLKFDIINNENEKLKSENINLKTKIQNIDNKFDKLAEENNELRNYVKEKSENLEDLKHTLSQFQKELNNMKLANDISESKKRNNTKNNFFGISKGNTASVINNKSKSIKEVLNTFLNTKKNESRSQIDTMRSDSSDDKKKLERDEQIALKNKLISPFRKNEVKLYL